MSAEAIDSKSRYSSVKKILISQPEAAQSNSPYQALKEKYNVEIDFIPFIQVEGVPYKEFRKNKIDFLAHTAVVFTSRNAVDHFFRICKEMKVEMPAEMKYFCVSDQTAHYLQKYITIRKRKLFVGTKTTAELIEILKKHKGETFVYPCSDIRKDDVLKFFDENNVKYSEGVMYRTVSSNLSHVKDIHAYDLIAFFSPSGVKSLFENFEGFEQKNIRIAAFGPTTGAAVIEHGLTLDIQAPMPNAPSMTGAIELFLKETLK